MKRTYHNHTLRTNSQHHEEEPQNIYRNKTSERQKIKTTSSLYLVKMFSKLEWTKGNAYQTKTNTEPHKQWEEH